MVGTCTEYEDIVGASTEYEDMVVTAASITNTNILTVVFMFIVLTLISIITFLHEVATTNDTSSL